MYTKLINFLPHRTILSQSCIHTYIRLKKKTRIFKAPKHTRIFNHNRITHFVVTSHIRNTDLASFTLHLSISSFSSVNIYIYTYIQATTSRSHMLDPLFRKRVYSFNRVVKPADMPLPFPLLQLTQAFPSSSLFLRSFYFRTDIQTGIAHFRLWTSPAAQLYIIYKHRTCAAVIIHTARVCAKYIAIKIIFCENIFFLYAYNI